MTSGRPPAIMRRHEQRKGRARPGLGPHQLLPDVRRARDAGLQGALRSDVAALQEQAAAAGPLSAATAGRWEAVVLSLEDIEARLGHIMAYVECLGSADAPTRPTAARRPSSRRSAPKRRRPRSTCCTPSRRRATTTSPPSRPAKSSRGGGHRLRRLRRRAAHTMAREQEKLAADLAVDGLHAWGRMYNTVSGKLDFEMKWPDGTASRRAHGAVARPHELGGPRGRPRRLRGRQPRVGPRRRRVRGRHQRHRRQPPDAQQVPRPRPLPRARALPVPGRPRNAGGDVRRDPRARSTSRAASSRPRRGPSGAPASGGSSGRLPSLSETQGRSHGKAARGWWAAPLPGSTPTLRSTTSGRWESGGSRARSGRASGPGAFCTGSGLTGEQRVYMTFGGALRDVSTLAHETGHAWHGWLMRDLRPMARGYPMTLAETASVFAEQILAEGVAEDPGLPDAQKLLDARRRALRRGDHAAGHHGALRVRAGLPRRARLGRGRRLAPRRADGGSAAPRLGRRPAARRHRPVVLGQQAALLHHGDDLLQLPLHLRLPAGHGAGAPVQAQGRRVPRRLRALSAPDRQRLGRRGGAAGPRRGHPQPGVLGLGDPRPRGAPGPLRGDVGRGARHAATPRSSRRRPRRWRGTRRPRAAGGARCRRAGTRPGSPAPARPRRSGRSP